MADLQLTPEAYRPSPPERRDWGIGLVGCGGIAQHAHLPAYRTCEYRVVAACDLREEALAAVRERFGVPHTTTSLHELLNDEAVQILDLAVHATQRLGVVEDIVAHRPPHLRAILSQKPLAMTLPDAQRIVELCEGAGLVFMVNQQARWAPLHRAIRQVLDSGALGHVYSIVQVLRSFQDVPGSWYAALENFNLIDHGIHYIDLLRWFAGAEPVRVKATAVRQPGQAAVSPMCHSLLCEFAPERMLLAESHFNNIVRTPLAHSSGWYLDGTEGSLVASANELTLHLVAEPHTKRTWQIQGSWFPEAFGGSMGELMRALNEGREPLTSGRDNLRSVAVAYAAVESAATGEAAAVQGGRAKGG